MFAERDRRLIKYDANLRNMIVRDRKIFHVDFECGRVLETLLRGAAREISRYATDLIRAMGREHADAVSFLLVKEYTHSNVLQKIVRDGSKKNRSQESFFCAGLGTAAGAGGRLSGDVKTSTPPSQIRSR